MINGRSMQISLAVNLLVIKEMFRSSLALSAVCCVLFWLSLTTAQQQQDKRNIRALGKR